MDFIFEFVLVNLKLSLLSCIQLEIESSPEFPRAHNFSISFPNQVCRDERPTCICFSFLSLDEPSARDRCALTSQGYRHEQGCFR